MTHTITVGIGLIGVALSPDGSKVFIANNGGSSAPGTFSVIENNAVADTINGFSHPVAFGVFIPPAIPFSSLSASLVLTGGTHPALAANAFFSPGAGSTGINPPALVVTVHIGTYAATIPAGSFKQLASGKNGAVWAYSGTSTMCRCRATCCGSAAARTSSAPPQRRSI